jgi:DNA modification methylase
MKTTNLPLEKLIAYAGNPRRNDHAVEAVAAAIKRFGFRVPVLAKSDGTLIDGHLRIKAAKRLGMTEVPVALCDDLSEAEIKALRISINRMAELAEWDEELLMAELEGLAAEGITMDDVGFDLDALEALGASVEPEGNPEADAEPQIDKAEELRAKWGVEPGQLWELGDHRLLCGDSTKKEDVERVMGGERADLCFTSPPYGQQRDYTEESKEKISDWDGLMRGVFANIPMAESGQVLVNLGMIHREGEWIPYWDGWIVWMREQGWRRFGWYVWDQGFGLPGDWNGRLAPSHEFVFHFNRASIRPEKWLDKKPENIKQRNKGESTMRGKDGKTKAFTNPAASGQPTKIPESVIRVGRQVGSDGHPAQFPVAFPAFILQSWLGIAYEPFSGSGTTIIACEQLGRKCRAIEISPAYVAVALQRWADATGKTPRLVP